jgi:hypothetical protein
VNEFLAVFVAFAATLDELGIPYAIVGSVASSAHGEQRATAGADFIVDSNDDQAVALAGKLGDSHYIDLASIRRAIAQSRSFNVVELATMFKLDVYVVSGRANEMHRLANSRAAQLASDMAPLVRIASPEDTIISKLRCFRRGGEVSEKQWTDVLGVLRVQRGRLDVEYMERAAGEERVRDLLDRAVAQIDEEER